MTTTIDKVRLEQERNLQEGMRQMRVCNACRYCQGYCGVFRAMQGYRDFENVDLHYLANLCHNCRACYYACQYGEPHEFAINIPQILAKLRIDSYVYYAFPQFLAKLFRSNGMLVSWLSFFIVSVWLGMSVMLYDKNILFGVHPEDMFYALLSHGEMVGIFAVIFMWSLFSMLVSGVRFYRDSKQKKVKGKHIKQTLNDALILKNLDGGGYGCNYSGESFGNKERYLHQFMMYGFLLCFAATSVGTIYHYILGWEAPYGYMSIPVILGFLGGNGIIVGTLGLLYYKFTADKKPAYDKHNSADVAFLSQLFCVAMSGQLLLFLRETSAMGVLLIIHLGFVFAFFVVMPYSKFVHVVYRLIALLVHAREKDI